MLAMRYSVACAVLTRAAASLLPFAVAATALGGQYEALCGGSKCTIVVTPDEIRSPYGAIPTQRVTYWGSTGDSKTSVGTGVATTILTGGIGLLGFLAKNHQYDFTINGFDASGKQSIMQIEFKNNKPAKRLMDELVLVTGLGMGQTRTIEEIKAIENGTAEKVGTLNQKNINIGPVGSSSEGGSSSGQSLGSVNTGQKVAPAQNCWSTYLDRNPAMKEWSEANPAMAEQNKKRFDDC